MIEGRKRTRRSSISRRSAGISASARTTLVIEDAIPRHIGLGSGTQIALAVAAALRTLHALPLDTADDARCSARGSRSGIGIASFEEGGVIVDAGKDDSGRPPPVISRIPFPEAGASSWSSTMTRTGMHGEAEIEAFRDFAAFPGSDVG